MQRQILANSIEDETQNFIEFAKENGAFDWQYGNPLDES